MRLEPWRSPDEDFGASATLGRWWCRDLSADLFEEGGVLVAKVALPGVAPEDIEVSLQGDVLTVSGTRQEESEVDEKEYYSKEIRRGSFYRSLRLPKAVEVENVTTAQYHDGVLTVVLPITTEEEHVGVRIPVQGFAEKRK